MREDLQYVVSDCGRTKGPSNKTRKWSPPHQYSLEDDGSPTHVPMRPRKGYVQKHFGFRHKPLERSLKAYVGKPWNQMYSALCHVFRRPTVVTVQALEYVNRMMTHGEHQHWTPDFQINPETGVLEIPQELLGRRRRHPKNCICDYHHEAQGRNFNHLTATFMHGKEWRPIDKTRYAEKEDGIWYVYTIGQHDLDDVATHARVSSIFGDAHDRWRPVTYRERPDLHRWYVADKRQANSKMLRRLGVRNAHPLTINA